MTDLVRALERRGLRAGRNFPYRGGYITRHYGPAMMGRGGGALQIEINKDLYVDPDSQSVLPDRAADLRRRLRAAFQDLVDRWSAGPEDGSSAG